MRRFTKFTLLLAILLLASSDLYADPAIGSGDGLNSTVAGIGNTASGEYSSAFGYGNTAEGNNSSAFGNSSYAIGDNSTAIGYQAVANYENTVSFGHGSGDSDGHCGSYSDELNSRLVSQITHESAFSNWQAHFFFNLVIFTIVYFLNIIYIVRCIV